MKIYLFLFLLLFHFQIYSQSEIECPCLDYYKQSRLKTSSLLEFYRAILADELKEVTLSVLETPNVTQSKHKLITHGSFILFNFLMLYALTLYLVLVLLKK